MEDEELVPPGMEEEEEQLKCTIESKLKHYSNPILGMEYLVELFSEEEKVLRFLCTLCDKRGDVNNILNHMSNSAHYTLYLQKYFPRLHKLYSDLPKTNDNKYQVGLVTNHLLRALEHKYGRLSPCVVREEIVINPATKLLLAQKIESGPHITECQSTEELESILHPDYLEHPENLQKNFPLPYKLNPSSVEAAKNLPEMETDHETITGNSDEERGDVENSYSPEVVAKREVDDIIEVSPSSEMSDRSISPDVVCIEEPLLETRSSSSINKNGLRSMLEVMSPTRRGRSRSPYMRGRSPHMRGRSPHMRGRSPHLRGRSPHMRGRSPHMRGRSRSPHMRGRVRYSPSISYQRYRRSRSIDARRPHHTSDSRERDLEKQYQDELKAKETYLNAKKEYYSKHSEKHPAYQQEWERFWNRRYKELQQEGIHDPKTYDYKPDWIVVWSRRLNEMHDAVLNEYKAEQIKKYDMLRRGISPSPPLKARKPRTVAEVDLTIRDSPAPSRSVSSSRRHKLPSSRSPSPSGRGSPSATEKPAQWRMIDVLRSLSVIEHLLGTFASHVMTMLTSAVAMEKAVPGSSEDLATPENIVFLDTIQEKLNTQILSNMIRKNLVRTVKYAVDKVNDYLTMIAKTRVRAMSQLPSPILLPPPRSMMAMSHHYPFPSPQMPPLALPPGYRGIPQPVPQVAGSATPPDSSQRVELGEQKVALPPNYEINVKPIDKIDMARRIAKRLMDAGETDIQEDELHLLIKSSTKNIQTLYRKRYDEQTQRLASASSPPIVIKKEKDASAFETAPSDEKSKVASPPPKNDNECGIELSDTAKAMESLSEEDMGNLLLNFNDLTREEQLGLVELLRKFEKTDTAKVDRLKAMIGNEDDSDNEKQEEQQPQRNEDQSAAQDSDDDYTLDDVYKAASKNVAEQITKNLNATLNPETEHLLSTIKSWLPNLTNVEGTTGFNGYDANFFSSAVNALAMRESQLRSNVAGPSSSAISNAIKNESEVQLARKLAQHAEILLQHSGILMQEAGMQSQPSVQVPHVGMQQPLPGQPPLPSYPPPSGARPFSEHLMAQSMQSDYYSMSSSDTDAYRAGYNYPMGIDPQTLYNQQNTAYMNSSGATFPGFQQVNKGN